MIENLRFIFFNPDNTLPYAKGRGHGLWWSRNVDMALHVIAVPGMKKEQYLC